MRNQWEHLIPELAVDPSAIEGVPLAAPVAGEPVAPASPTSSPESKLAQLREMRLRMGPDAPALPKKEGGIGDWAGLISALAPVLAAQGPEYSHPERERTNISRYLSGAPQVEDSVRKQISPGNEGQMFAQAAQGVGQWLGSRDDRERKSALLDAEEQRKSGRITDAQAELLMRHHGLSPESVAGMTGDDLDSLSSLIARAPYAESQSQNRALKQSTVERQEANKSAINTDDNQSAEERARISADARVKSAGLRGKGKGGGGGGGAAMPRDDLTTTANILSVTPDTVSQALDAVKTGNASDTQQLIASRYQMVSHLGPGDYAKANLKGVGGAVAQGTADANSLHNRKDRQKLREEVSSMGGALSSVTSALKAFTVADPVTKKPHMDDAALEAALQASDDALGRAKQQSALDRLTPAQRSQVGAFKGFAMEVLAARSGKAFSGQELRNLEAEMGVTLDGETGLRNFISMGPGKFKQFVRKFNAMKQRRMQTIEADYPGLFEGGE